MAKRTTGKAAKTYMQMGRNVSAQNGDPFKPKTKTKTAPKPRKAFKRAPGK